MSRSSLRKLVALTLAAASIAVASLAATAPAQAGDVSVRFGFGAPVYDDYDDGGFVEYGWSDRRDHVRPRHVRPNRHSPRYVYERPARYRQHCRLVPNRVWDEEEGDFDIVDVRRCRNVARW